MKNLARLRLLVLPLFISALVFAYGWNGSPALAATDITDILSVECDTPDTDHVTVHFDAGGDVVMAYTLEAPNKLRYYIGSNDVDVMKGTDGNDVMIGYGGDDIFCAGDGNDTVSAGDGDDIIIGGNGVDTLVGYGGNDYIEGNAGKDRLIGSNGDDILVGITDDQDICSGATGDDTSINCDINSSVETVIP